jgi:hypothetical protein
MVRNMGILKKAIVCSHPREGTPSTLMMDGNDINNNNEM